MRAVALAGAPSTGWAAPGLAVARRAAALAGGLTSCAASAAATAATRSIRPAVARDVGPRTVPLAAVPATSTSLPAVPATSTSLPAATLAALVGKLSHCLAACLATTTLISRLSAHISRLHQALLIESNQIQATGLRKRLHH